MRSGDIGQLEQYAALVDDFPEGTDRPTSVLWVMTAQTDASADLNEHGMNDWTPLHEAAIREDFDCIRLLLNAGADKSVKSRIDDSATAEHEARLLGHIQSANLIRDYIAN